MALLPCVCPWEVVAISPNVENTWLRAGTNPLCPTHKEDE